MTKIKWNFRAFEQLRREPGVKASIDARAKRIAAAAGDGYEAGSYAGKTRHRGSVITANTRAMRDNAKNNTLLRSIDAGR